MNKQIIIIQKRNVYGNELIYPKNFVKALRDLTGQKTLSNRQINALEELGCVVQDERCLVPNKN